MARALDEIMRELDASYNPQRQSIESRLSALPGQAESEVKGLEAKQTQAFDNILSGARNRGLGFSGIPLGEQAQYTASEFLPAVARVKSSQQETTRSLYDALNNVNLEQNRYAQTLRQGELDRDEQIRQFNETLAEQRRQAAAQNQAFSGLMGASGGGGSNAPAKYTQRGDKGFNFTDAAGRPISAAQYAQATGTPFRKILDIMARAGDKGAQAALGFVGDDFGYDPGKIGGNVDLYNALVWGTGRNANAVRAKQQVQNAANIKPQPVSPVFSTIRAGGIR